MNEKQIRITIDPALNETLEHIMNIRNVHNPDQCIGEVLELYSASLGPVDSIEGDADHEREVLRMKIAWLEELLERKERALATLVDLWEECVLDRQAREEEPTDIDDRISQLIRDWYFDAERRDHSGADGGKPGHV